MSDGEKVRASGETPREQSLPTVNPAAEKTEQPSTTFHPAVYVTAWITLSSTVILFNKYLLDYANFRESNRRYNAKKWALTHCE
jgi:hypothetical protein